MAVFAPHPLSGARRSATWRLRPGQALSLRPAQPGVLSVAAGSLWATADGPHPGPGNDRGDRVFQAGERVRIAAGERIVIEPVGGEARFDWDPASPVRRRLAAALWCRAGWLRPAVTASL